MSDYVADRIRLLPPFAVPVALPSTALRWHIQRLLGCGLFALALAGVRLASDLDCATAAPGVACARFAPDCSCAVR